MKRIIVEIYDGLVSAVYVDCEEYVSVDVLDYDVLRDNDCTKEEETFLINLSEEVKTMHHVY